ncbi:NAD(P)-dependent oxidoreductase [Nocardia farcinica]|uniref:NAD(P)-dependent oxidoreductase n=1 Tax=Nocardia farcinica TaxID=37329 RepID=UPI0037AD1380
MRVGFIGLGIQGAPMARRIAGAGYPTTLWARRPRTLEQFADTAAETAGSPAELAASSDLVCLCVVSDVDVREVLDGRDGVRAGLRRGSVLAVHSTVHPDTCRILAEELRPQGISVIDAPVTGGGPAAAEGRLTVLVGGPDDAVDRCRPVFETFGERVVHLGGVGAGQVAKIVNNLLFTANLAAATSALDLGAALGLDADRLGELLTHGTGNSFALGRIVAAGGTLHSIAAHANELLRKDVRLATDLADRAGAESGIVFQAAENTLAALDNLRGK